MDYSDNQKTAIQTCDKNIRIIACAGSGKTSTIAGKVAHLLHPGNKLDIHPENIIAFTYTNRASAELQNKILNEVGELRGMADMFIGTIHSWCLSALKAHVFEYQNFEVLDEVKLRLYVDKYYRTIGMTDVTKISHPDVCLRRYVDSKIFTAMMDILRESELTRELPPNVAEAKVKYENTLLRRHHFDFSMCMDKALECLNTNQNLRKQIADKLKYLIVDEYQDINPIQNRIIEKLQEISSCYLIVVGDDDQNIYQWRGSNNQFIIDFHNRFEESQVQSVPLDINYRSSEGNTRLAQEFISNNKNRIQSKQMSSNKAQTFERGRDILFNVYNSTEEEDLEIARYVEKIKGTVFSEDGEPDRGIAYSDICILLRTWRRAETIAAAFDRMDVPYITAGVNQLFDVHEVQAAVNIFRFLSAEIAPEDLRASWLSIPHNALDPAKLDAAVEAISKLKPAQAEDDQKWDYSLQDIYWEFLETANIYEDSFISNNTPDQRERAEIILFNLGKFSQVINDFEEVNYNTVSPTYHLSSFLNFIKYAAQDYYPEGWLSNEYKTPNAVQIMTIHQAKGLEFPVVIIPGLNKNYFPQKKHGGLNVWHFLDRSLISNQDRYEPADNTEDERRLLYVAITRSQKYLLITRAPDQHNQLYRRESAFITELNQANVLRSNRDFSFFDLAAKLEPEPKQKTKNMTLDFTTLKDYFECAFRFKLVSMYGFRFPLNPRMGMGQSLHNVLMELHKKGRDSQPIDLAEIIDRQTHFPYIGAYKKLEADMRRAITKNVAEYYQQNRDSFPSIVFVEQDIQYKIDKEILVLGRVDLIKKEKEFGKYETTIVEFKSKEDVQATTLTDDQLLLYALGHRELTGETADYIMTYIIGGATPQAKTPRVLHKNDLELVQAKIKSAADRIRDQKFDKCSDPRVCKDCYQNSLCTERARLGLRNNRTRRQ